MKKLVKPPRLRSGGRVAAVSLSWGGPAVFPHRYEIGKKQFEKEFDMEVVESTHALRDPHWLASNPKARAEDFMESLVDDSIDAIISTIGGDDSVRMMPFLDLELIGRHPKVVMGYSDFNVTNFACLAAGMVSFSGPTFMAGFGENRGIFPYTAEAVRRTLFSSKPVGEIKPCDEGWTVEHLDWANPANQSRRRQLSPNTGWRWLQGSGTAVGHLIGGCTEVLEWLKATAWWPGMDVWEGAILFLETSEEAPPAWMFKRWLRNYGSQGILQKLSGLIVGRPGGQISESDFEQYDNAVLAIVAGELGLTSLPVITRMDFGHTDPMFVVPVGTSATINCDNRTFAINEAAVI